MFLQNFTHQSKKTGYNALYLKISLIILYLTIFQTIQKDRHLGKWT